jgi:hypothetical protein
MSRLADLLFKKYMEWQQELGERKTLKEFAEHIDIGNVFLNQLMNDRRSAGEKTIKHLAEFFHDLSFYDAVGIPRPDPLLTFIIKQWGSLSEDGQKKIAEEMKKYGSK